MTRPDDIILDHIKQSLWMEKTISAIDYHDISVGVENGQVFLSGHVSKEYNNQHIEEIARSIPGVRAIHNHIVTDIDLRNQVAQALGENENTYTFFLPVSCYHGWVKVGGHVQTRQQLRIVEATTASVAYVRGVILLPDIIGGDTFQERDAVQPGIGVHVLGEAKTDGTVYQVVISPQNRLVTHAIVRVKRIANGWQDGCDYLIPIEAMGVVGVGGIILNSNTPAIHQFPYFTTSDYPFAPLTWQPPYPYAVGRVRWPRLDNLNNEQRITINNRETAILNKFNHRHPHSKEI